MTTPTTSIPSNNRRSWPLVLIVGAALVWAYWPTLVLMVHRWRTVPQASHGYLIAPVALLLLRAKRNQRPTSWPAGYCWSGLFLLVDAMLLRMLGAYIAFEWLEAVSLLLALAGVAVLLGGWPALRWSWPAIAFLVFMLPLPYQLETALSGPLQRLATVCSTYTLQTLGYPAISEGNIIVLEQSRVGVVEACNGLGMLFAFFAISTAVALLIHRPLLDRVIVFVSAVPIGVAANLVRITLTAIAHQTLGSTKADRLFHDYAGWLMMPLALAMLAIELWLLNKLLVPRPTELPHTRDAGPPPAERHTDRPARTTPVVPAPVSSNALGV